SRKPTWWSSFGKTRKTLHRLAQWCNPTSQKDGKSGWRISDISSRDGYRDMRRLLQNEQMARYREAESGMIPAESIERVIDDFRTRIEKLRPFAELEYVNGGMMAYEMAIRELRKVVEEYGPRKS